MIRASSSTLRGLDFFLRSSCMFERPVGVSRRLSVLTGLPDELCVSGGLDNFVLFVVKSSQKRSLTQIHRHMYTRTYRHTDTQTRRHKHMTKDVWSKVEVVQDIVTTT